LFPLQSPLLRESLLVSFPPLNYMLKFRGSSCVSEAQVKYRPHLDTSEINSSHAQTTCRRCEFRAEAPTSRNSHPALQQTSAGS
ncbi:hypothetical protein T484DRAFT_1649219, partial [Baffinella frigidus]